MGVMMRLESRFCFSGERQKRKIVQPNPSRRSETSRSKERRNSPSSLVYFKTNLIPHYASRSIEEVARDQGVKVLDRVSLRFLRPNEYRHLRISRKGKGHSYKPKPLEKTPPRLLRDVKRGLRESLPFDPLGSSMDVVDRNGRKMNGFQAIPGRRTGSKEEDGEGA